MPLTDRVLELGPRERYCRAQECLPKSAFLPEHVDGIGGSSRVDHRSNGSAAALFSFADSGDESRPERNKLVYYFLGVGKAKFMRDVVPGDQLRIEVQALRLSRAICKYRGSAFTDEDLAYSV